MTDHQHVSVPKVLRPIRILMFVQAILSIIAGVFIAALVSAFDANDESGAAVLTAAAVVGILLGALLLTCAVLLPRRLPWVRATVIAIEAINGVSGLIGLIYGIVGGMVQPTTVIPVVLSAVVIQALTRAEARAWFAREETPVP